jgi:hypothetical protein
LKNTDIGMNVFFKGVVPLFWQKGCSDQRAGLSFCRLIFRVKLRERGIGEMVLKRQTKPSNSTENHSKIHNLSAL